MPEHPAANGTGIRDLGYRFEPYPSVSLAAASALTEGFPRLTWNAGGLYEQQSGASTNPERLCRCVGGHKRQRMFVACIAPDRIARLGLDLPSSPLAVSAPQTFRPRRLRYFRQWQDRAVAASERSGKNHELSLSDRLLTAMMLALMWQCTDAGSGSRWNSGAVAPL